MKLRLKLCRSRQRLHRTIDIGLIVVASISAVLFLIAFGAIRHFDPNHAHVLEFIRRLCLLHCIGSLTTPLGDLNLFRMNRVVRQCVTAARQ